MNSAVTGILMLNMGGPATLEDVQPFLERLFADRDILRVPFQRHLGHWIAEKRAPKVRARYAEIGGGSPILHWTEVQGAGMAKWLDEIAPHTAPHRAYVAFRYALPDTEMALRRMNADGVRRAVALTQYPQYSCTTTGSSLNELWRTVQRLGLEEAFDWHVIDRWPTQAGFVAAIARSVRAGLDTFPAAERAAVTVLFSAHSIPLSVAQQGDPYPQEVQASVQAVQADLQLSNPYCLGYQSAAGPQQWVGPSTASVLKKLGAQGCRNVLVVPITFTSDHIETLYEIDVEYAELARQVGIVNFRRAPALNDDVGFQRALAEIVAGALNL